MRSPIVRFAAFFFLSLLGFSVLSVATALQNHLHLAETGIAASATWMASLPRAIAASNSPNSARAQER